MGAEPRPPALTDDAVLGGRLKLLQPARGHRVGHDAILLAASTATAAGDVVVDLGAGVGAAGLALALRRPGVMVRLVELDAELADLAAQNAARNGLASRVTAHVLDVAAPLAAFDASGLGPETADRVMMNPPFNDASRSQASPDGRRRLAHMAPPGALATWIGTAARLLVPNGTLTLIGRADGLRELLGLLETGFGAVTVQPVHPKPDAPAIRVLARAHKGSRAPLALLPGLVLNGSDGRPTAEAEAVLRAGEALRLANA